MKPMNQRDAAIDKARREELIELLSAATRHEGVVESSPGIRLARATEPTERIYSVSKPCLCVIAQGAKEVYVGDSRYRYDADRYLIATLELPLTGRVVEASKEWPYLSLRLELDPALVSSVMVEADLPAPTVQGEAKAVFVSALDAGLLDAVVRLARLVHAPDDAKVLMPPAKREIVYRLLKGEQGERLRHLPMLGGHTHRIAQAVDRLRKAYDQQVSIDGLARELGMSPSGFHHHFKTVMDMSPLQYQKLIRLQEARQLMLGESLDASSAGYRVGYDDPSHFSRDYKKHFGNSPVRDVERLRSMAIAD